MIAVFGGESGVLSQEGLENCLALPMMSVYGTETNPSLWEKAASLLHCLVTRHPFVDGNKRTSWAAAKVFLLLNGFRLSTEHDDGEQTILNVISGKINKDQLADWIESHSNRI